jgi:hypothetical protein
VPYSSTRSNRFYPGRVAPDRRKALAGYAVPIDELTTDDLVYQVSVGPRAVLYDLIGIVMERFGQEAGVAVMEVAGRRNGATLYAAWLQHNGVSRGSAELMAQYQDIRHFAAGPEHATAFSEYGDDYCVVRRVTCAYHDPDAPLSLCQWFGQAHVDGYISVDPAIVREAKPACLSWGDSYCERAFWFAAADADGP